MYYTSESKGGRRLVYCHFANFSAEPWKNVRDARRLLEDLGQVYRLAAADNYAPVIWRFNEAMHEAVVRSYQLLDGIGITIPEMEGANVLVDASFSLYTFMGLPVDFSANSQLYGEAKSSLGEFGCVYHMDWSDLCLKMEKSSAFG